MISSLKDAKILRADGWKRILLLVIRLTFGSLFLANGLSKIEQPYDFLATIYSYGLFGPNLSYFFALVLPWIELTLAIFLFADLALGGAFLVTSVLLAAFVLAKAFAVHRALKIGCGCQIIAVGDVVGIDDVLVTSTIFAVACVGYWCVLSEHRTQT